MRFENGVFSGARVYGDEAARLFRLYESDGLEYVCLDVSRGGMVTGLLQMAGVAAHFNVVFESAREAIRYARQVHRPTPPDPSHA